jgi:hypothetical protein
LNDRLWRVTARRRHLATVVAAVLAALAGCGGSGKPTAAGQGTQAPAALSPEARSAATGDIPDNQVFLVFRDSSGGYAMKYPEGWAQRGSGRDVTFADKNNIVHVVVGRGTAPSPGLVLTQLDRLRASTPSLSAGSPQRLTINGASAVKVVYTTKSAANPVTGKRVLLVVDRYVLAHNGKRAVVDLGTPKGVDNVDAYRLIIQSFRWL